MEIRPAPLSGVYELIPTPVSDHRGFFARMWCADELKEAGLIGTLDQCSVSFNIAPGTLRGLHFQIAPAEETKVVRCTQGRIFDVAVDVRPDSPTFLKWFGRELSAENRVALYIPAGFAHGFQTLVENSEVLYMISTPYRPELARTIAWNDSRIGIEWPGRAAVISEKDAGAASSREVLGA